MLQGRLTPPCLLGLSLDYEHTCLSNPAINMVKEHVLQKEPLRCCGLLARPLKNETQKIDSSLSSGV